MTAKAARITGNNTSGMDALGRNSWMERPHQPPTTRRPHPPRLAPTPSIPRRGRAASTTPNPKSEPGRWCVCVCARVARPAMRAGGVPVAGGWLRSYSTAQHTPRPRLGPSDRTHLTLLGTAWGTWEGGPGSWMARQEAALLSTTRRGPPGKIPVDGSYSSGELTDERANGPPLDSTPSAADRAISA
jgi:hypothetical protein